MRNQTRYLSIYTCVMGILVGTSTQLVLAQDVNQPQALVQNDSEVVATVQLNQAELDQMLAPIALYPDTLLSHILVASTYPLEVIQAARWRANNDKMDAQQALNAVEGKNWDPSVKALVPFNDLLQKFSQDLDWLQGLGDAFLLNEEQVLSSIQKLRQKAYAQGNLGNNDYIEVSKDEGQIVIETVVKEVVYVPYYDTRVVYGDWWWGAYPPYYWHRPSHYVWSSGFYWSPSYYIHPSFYFGGVYWSHHHVVANYHYHNTARNYPHGRRVVSVRDYPRWNHNPEHRRGVRYDHQQNPNRFVNSGQQQGSKKSNQIDKQRVLNVEKLNNRDHFTRQDVVISKKNADRQQPSNEGIKKRLQNQQQLSAARNESHTKNNQNDVTDKKRIINANNNEPRGKAVNQNKQEHKGNSNTSKPYTPAVEGAKETRNSQAEHNTNSESSRKYSSTNNRDNKSKEQRNSRRQSSSERQQRPSKSTRNEQDR